MHSRDQDRFFGRSGNLAKPRRRLNWAVRGPFYKGYACGALVRHTRRHTGPAVLGVRQVRNELVCPSLALVSIPDHPVEISTFRARRHQALMDVRWNAAIVVGTSLLEHDFHPACSGIIADSCNRRRVDANHIHSAFPILIDDVLEADTSRRLALRCLLSDQKKVSGVEKLPGTLRHFLQYGA